MENLLSHEAEYVLVTDNDALNNLCQLWQSLSHLAIDTEFMRVDTFYPKVALLQINDGEGNYLIDPLLISDWKLFSALMLKPEITKIFHSCSEDLLVFIHHFALLPSPIFDTQIANAFLNQGFGLSYQNLIAEQMGIDVPKAETRSDWLQRPLSDEQLHYAALDVAFLPEIYARQVEALQAMGRLEWVKEDCQRLLGNYKDEIEQDFSQAYLNISAAWQLDARQLGILKALASWREQRARQRNKPRNWIVRDKELMNIAKYHPANMTDLSNIDGLHANFINYEGAAVLEIVQQVLNLHETALPERIARPLSGAQKKHFRKAQQFVEQKAEELHLPVEVLGRKRTLMQMFQDILNLSANPGQKAISLSDLQLPSELQGWRRDILVPGLLELMQ